MVAAIMRWQHPTAYTGLLLAWAALAGWQWHDYGHERELVRDTVRRQADSVKNALVGGIRSHRRLGRFFHDQLQGALDELVKSEDILAVAVVSHDGDQVLSAGSTERLDTSPPIATGEFWEAGGFRLVSDFELSPDTGEGPHGLGGGGYGGGRGWGRGSRWQPDSGEDDEGPFSAGGKFAAILLLDRKRADVFCRNAAWQRSLVTAAGGVVLICIALAWLATVRWVEARGRARVLEAETRHFRDLSQAAAGLAHETRNPLGLIRGWTQRLAQSNLPSPEQQQQVQTIVEECDRVTSRINQFLAFARPCDPQPEAVDPDRFIDELAVLLEPDLDAKGLQLEHATTPPGSAIQADREMLRQALFNLVRNAIQFAPDNGTVEIAVRSRQDGLWRVEVADRGPGVPAEEVESLFTPYFTTRSNGTGLGLAIVRRIATAHGWNLGYTPRPGGGSIFWLDQIDG